MIFWLSAGAWTAFGLSTVVTLTLLVYLDLRLHALKQAGDLPASTPRLFGFAGNFTGIGQTIDFAELYSRRYREIDSHTRLLVPIVRVSLPSIPLLLALAVWVSR